MNRKLGWAVACTCLITAPVLAQSNWTGAISDDWSVPGNWDNGVPNLSPNVRARIKKTADTGNWPVIKSGASFTQGGRIQAPFDSAPEFSGTTTYSRLTIDSGATVHVGDDFLFGENSGFATAPIVGSLNVAGTLTVGERMRFGDNDFMTLDVDVTGTMKQTVDNQDFRIGRGNNSFVDFDISGGGLVEVLSQFEIGSGGDVTLSDNGTLKLVERAGANKVALIGLIYNYAKAGRIEGLTSNYGGPETLTSIGYGLAYYEGSNFVSFVSIPEPSTLLLTLPVLAGVIGLRRRRMA